MVAVTADATLAQVVIVDDSTDTREVLQTLLARRGIAAVDAAAAWEGLELIRRHRPAVIVFDVDSEAARDAELREELEHVKVGGLATLVALGDDFRSAESLPGVEVIPKPYHYAPLLRTIERLLAEKSLPAACNTPVDVPPS